MMLLLSVTNGSEMLRPHPDWLAEELPDPSQLACAR
jgi:hypothetical protein